jgi:hypothetical protein
MVGEDKAEDGKGDQKTNKIEKDHQGGQAMQKEEIKKTKNPELFSTIRTIMIMIALIACAGAHPLSTNAQGSSATGEGAAQVTKAMPEDINLDS